MYTNSWDCNIKVMKRWLTSAVHPNKPSSKLFTVSSYSKRYSFNKSEQDEQTTDKLKNGKIYLTSNSL